MPNLNVSRDEIISWLEEMAKIYDQQVRDLTYGVGRFAQADEDLRYARAISDRCHGAIELINESNQHHKVLALRKGLSEWPGERGAYRRVLKEMDALGL